MKMSLFSIREVTGDLFSAGNEYSMCHCVASDLRMGKGIAIRFRNKFGQLGVLQQQNVQPGGVAIIKDGQRFIYNLVTKQCSWGKPTYQFMHSSLTAMRQHMIDHQVKKLALPRIGCGLDGLSWSKIKDMLCELFQQDDIELIVYNYKPE
ncbi:ADP-ribose glycohydrolase OARD1 [Drosophila tropicalis]|uniref:ADP-ribose glycohydrolase OARD1 n=1 Tax=Drosophila tropicalis TaxID=46794 RepID=UPI0035AC0792